MKKRYLLAIALVAFLAAIIQIAANQAEARDQVASIIKKDEAGEDVSADIQKLKQYTESHMQTSTNLTLTGSYTRALAAERAKNQTGSNGDVYAKAQAACVKRSDSVTQAKCVSNYVAANSTPGANPQPVNMPNQADYTKNFESPNWTSDAAGLTLLAGICALVMAVYVGLWL